jgi:hypothetical protein
MTTGALAREGSLDDGHEPTGGVRSAVRFVLNGTGVPRGRARDASATPSSPPPAEGVLDRPSESASCDALTSKH